MIGSWLALQPLAPGLLSAQCLTAIGALSLKRIFIPRWTSAGWLPNRPFSRLGLLKLLTFAAPMASLAVSFPVGEYSAAE